ncbi:MAG: hypothetical protein IJN83_09330 [Clostridia bacterium]|nr:hypothetical protein [Clostridia bacterium]
MKGIDSTVYAKHMTMADRQSGRQDRFCSVCAVIDSTNHRITMHRAQ